MLDVRQSEDAQFPVVVELNDGDHKLTIAAAEELYARLHVVISAIRSGSRIEAIEALIHGATLLRDYGGWSGRYDAGKALEATNIIRKALDKIKETV